MSYKQTGTFAQRQPKNPAKNISTNLEEQPVIEAEKLLNPVLNDGADTFLTEASSKSSNIKENTASQVQPNCVSKVRSCSKCIKIRQKTNKKMCKKCYRQKYKQLHKECQKCGKLKRLNSSNLCKMCSVKATSENQKECLECLECKELELICIHTGFKNGANDNKKCQKCKKGNPILACGVCRSCYNLHFIGSKRRLPKIREEHQINETANNECKECKRTGYIFSFGTCISCHLKSLGHLNSANITCRECNELKAIVQNGLCESCSSKFQTNKKQPVCKNCGDQENCEQCCSRIKRPELRALRKVNSTQTRIDQSSTKTVCTKCYLTRPIAFYGMCEQCYNQELARPERIVTQPTLPNITIGVRVQNVQTVKVVNKHPNNVCKECKQSGYVLPSCGLCLKCRPKEKLSGVTPVIKKECPECGDIFNGNGLCDPCVAQTRQRIHKFAKNYNKKCQDCGQETLCNSSGLCQKCYDQIFKSTQEPTSSQNASKKCQLCSQTRHIMSSGICIKCYVTTCNQLLKQMSLTIDKKCLKCEQVKELKDGTCNECHEKHVIQISSDENEQELCKECNQNEPIEGTRTCKNCLYKARQEQVTAINYKDCVECKEPKVLNANEICNACYLKAFFASRIFNAQKKCHECKKVNTSLLENGMCQPCFDKLQVQLQQINDGKKCRECKQIKPFFTDGICQSCYTNLHVSTNEPIQNLSDYVDKRRKCQECGKFEIILARGMCKECYLRICCQSVETIPSVEKECSSCKQVKTIVANETCGPCFLQSQAKKLEESRKTRKDQDGVCKECDRTKKIRNRGLCRRCYSIYLKSDRECKGCLEVTQIHCLSLCKPCYLLKYPIRECPGCKQLEILNVNGICRACHALKNLVPAQCSECKEIKVLVTRGMCSKCYQRLYRQSHPFANSADPLQSNSSHATTEKVNDNKCQKCSLIGVLMPCGRCMVCCAEVCGQPKETDALSTFKFQSIQKSQQTCRECNNIGVLKHGRCKKCHYKRIYKQRKKNQRECVECKKVTLIYAKVVCGSCYRKLFRPPRSNNECQSKEISKKECVNCNQIKTIRAKDMCGNCYNKLNRKGYKFTSNVFKRCKECEQTKLIVAHGVCRKCYYQLYVYPKKASLKKHTRNDLNVEVQPQEATSKRKAKECRNCKQVKAVKVGGFCIECRDLLSNQRLSISKEHQSCQECSGSSVMCEKCYFSTYYKQIEESFEMYKQCKVCEEVTKIYAKEKCRPCYMNDYHKARETSSDTDKTNKCQKCNQSKAIVARGMCRQCHSQFVPTSSQASGSCSPCYVNDKTNSNQILKLEPKEESQESQDEETGY